MLTRNTTDLAKFNPNSALPYNLRTLDFQAAMQDVYDFFYDVNDHFDQRALPRLDDMLRPAICSGMISDMLTESLAKHSRTLKVNAFHNGHPDLIPDGRFPNNRIQAGDQGVEVKTTRKKGGAVDTHGGRDQWMAVFVYQVDSLTEPASQRAPMKFTEVYLNQVQADDFRRNERGDLGTRTSTLDRDGIARLRQGWVYLDM